VLSEYEKRDYVKLNGTRCPYCGDDDVGTFPQEATEGPRKPSDPLGYCDPDGSLRILAMCGCGKRWYDVYRLHTLEET
jgi:hypothetical protein